MKLIMIALLLFIIGDVQSDEKSCLGESGNAKVELLGNQCKKGDAIITFSPTHFCDFKYSIAFDSANLAYCIYVGEKRQERSTNISHGQRNTDRDKSKTN